MLYPFLTLHRTTAIRLVNGSTTSSQPITVNQLTPPADRIASMGMTPPKAIPKKVAALTICAIPTDALARP